MTSATGTRQTIDGVDHLVLTRTFTAAVEDVWDSITDSDRLARWFGTWTAGRSAGQVLVTMTFESDAMDPEPWTIEICEPPHRLRLHSQTEDAAQSWTLDVGMAESAGVTTMTFAQVLTEAVDVRDVGPGWDFYLDRLVAAETGGDVAAVTWGADYIALSDDYAERFSAAADGP